MNEKRNNKRNGNNGKDYKKATGGKNSRSNSKARGNSEERVGRDDGYSALGKVHCAGDTLHNDPIWYEPFPGATDLVARVSFGTPLGHTWGLDDYMFTQANGYMSKVAFPGIMRINYVPCPGIAKPNDPNAPINYLSHAYYTTVRYAQRGSGTYDDADLMLGVLGISSLYEFWAWMRRLYGVLNMYTVSNKYLAEPLFQSMGGNFKDFQNHIYDFQGYINNFALRLGQFCLPADFHIVDRRVRLNSNIYVDSESSKAQMYYFNPDGFWKYNELANENYSALELVTIPADTEGFTFSDLVAFGNDLYLALRTSQSLMNMAGDVKNAYGDGALKKIMTTPESYLAPILYDENMCMEIQNLTLVGSRNYSQEIKAMTSSNLIEYYPLIETDVGADYPVMNNFFFNFRKDTPTPQDVMRASRLVAYWDIEPSSAGGDSMDLYVSECGTEYCTDADLFYFYEHKDHPGVFTNAIESITTVSNSNPGDFRQATIAEKFDYHPYIYFFSNDRSALVTISGDVDNVTQLDEATAKKMNLYAIMGLIKTKMMDTFMTK